MARKLNDTDYVYRCYLGKDMGFRLQWIYNFLSKRMGRLYFNKYSTEKDSVADFIKRCDEKGKDLLPR